MKPIKTAILGYGRSGSTLHANPLEALPDFELTTVCDTDSTALEKAKNRFNCNVYQDYHDILKKDLDLIVIVTRTHQHCEMVCDCLNAGKNVLVTKPWALNEQEALKMISASERSGRMLLPWLPLRFSADLSELKKIVASKIIGNVFMIKRSVTKLGIRSDWQTEKRYGGGYLLNWGTHLVDQPVLLAGEPVKSVYAVMKHVANPGDAEDVFYAVMNTVNNITIVSEYNYGASGLPDWIVMGDKGTIFINNFEIEIHTASYPEKLDPTAYSNIHKIEVTKGEEGKINSKNQYGDEYSIYGHISRALRGTETYSVTTGDALTLTRTLDAIRQSAETGKVVVLL